MNLLVRRIAPSFVLTLVLALLLLPSGSAHADTYPTPTVSLNPSVSTVAAGQTFTLEIEQNASFLSAGIEGSLGFDPNLVRILNVERGPDYAAAFLIWDYADETNNLVYGADAIATANQHGHLDDLTTFIPPTEVPLSPGPHVALRLTLQAKSQAGTSALYWYQRFITIYDPNFGTPYLRGVAFGLLPYPYDLEGTIIRPNVNNSQVTVSAPVPPPAVGGSVKLATSPGGAASSPSATLIAGAAALLAALVGGVTWRLRRRGKTPIA